MLRTQVLKTSIPFWKSLGYSCYEDTNCSRCFKPMILKEDVDEDDVTADYCQYGCRYYAHGWRMLYKPVSVNAEAKQVKSKEIDDIISAKECFAFNFFEMSCEDDEERDFDAEEDEDEEGEEEEKERCPFCVMHHVKEYHISVGRVR
eukprot:m.16728 g.16728  ORF g.16728 m.16728 type:complete len:147 (-) comp5772_c0_seq2:166-606(-)